MSVSTNQRETVSTFPCVPFLFHVHFLDNFILIFGNISKALSCVTITLTLSQTEPQDTFQLINHRATVARLCWPCFSGVGFANRV